jgi:hypothetical protein
MSSAPWVAVVVRVPEKYFSDNDDICLQASKFVCSRLESHLIGHGHKIPNWVRGGCEEDWGVYFESQRDGQTFDYAVGFFPVAQGESQCYMAV